MISKERENIKTKGYGAVILAVGKDPSSKHIVYNNKLETIF